MISPPTSSLPKAPRAPISTLSTRGGGTSLDCNGDGLPDVVLAGDTNPAALYVNRSPIGGALKFSKADGADLGLTPKDLLDTIGAYALDINGDGKEDIVLLRHAGNRVLEGLGGCKFRRTDQEWHIDPGHAWTTAFAATSEAGNKFPTLAFGNYIDRTARVALRNLGAKTAWGHRSMGNWVEVELNDRPAATAMRSVRACCSRPGRTP